MTPHKRMTLEILLCNARSDKNVFYGFRPDVHAIDNHAKGDLHDQSTLRYHEERPSCQHVDCIEAIQQSSITSVFQHFSLRIIRRCVGVICFDQDLSTPRRETDVFNH